MSGGGGGSSGQVSYPEYLQVFHRDILNHAEMVFVTRSFVDVLNTAMGASPYDGVTVYDPVPDTVKVQNALIDFTSFITNYAPITNYEEAYSAVIALITLDTSALDSAALDTSSLNSTTADTAILGTTILSTIDADTAPTKDVASAAIAYTATSVNPSTASAPIIYTPSTITVDAIPIDEAAIEADVASYAALLRDQIENDVLPRFKAGMLNINAITSSAFVIGEALIWANYDRDVARYAADLRSKIILQNGQYNAQLIITEAEHESKSLLQTQNLNAGENLAYREQTSRYIISANEQNNSRVLQAQQLTAADALGAREEGSRYNLAFRDENKTYKVANSDQNSRFKLAFTSETKDLNISYSDQTTRLKLAASDQNARFKLANSDETVKLKLASSDQNMKFKLQQKELDASHKLNRQKNLLLAAAEIVRMMSAQIDFHKAIVDQNIRVSSMVITTENEQLHEQLVIDESHAKWEVELYQHAANLMAGISGGTAPNQKRTSKAVTALSGALSGAALGASVGGPYAPITAAAGAIIGGAAGYLTGG